MHIHDQVAFKTLEVVKSTHKHVCPQKIYYSFNPHLGLKSRPQKEEASRNHDWLGAITSSLELTKGIKS